MRAAASSIVAWMAVFLLAGCGEQEPVRIGFIAPLSGRFSSLGAEARDGTLLAISEANAADRPGKRPLELVVRDTAHEPEQARQAIRELIDAGVVAVIGPQTSDMAEVIVPIANEAGVPLVSPVVTSTQLAGVDDFFLRVVATNRQYATACARFFIESVPSRRAALILDDSQRAYTEDWAKYFEEAFRAGGGEVVNREHFYSDAKASLMPEVERSLAARPDLIVAVTNSVDAARIAHLVRQRDPDLRLTSAEVAATEQLIETGGRAVEGMYVPQLVDHDNTSAAYLAFRERYRERFGTEPGFAAIAAHDASKLVASVLADGPDTPRAMRERLLAHGAFEGLQQQIKLDQYGDASRNLSMSLVQAGRYRKVAELVISPGDKQ